MFKKHEKDKQLEEKRQTDTKPCMSAVFLWYNNAIKQTKKDKNIMTEKTKRNGQEEAEERLVQQLLNMGEMLLSSGAEIKRVEDTLTRMGKAYGARKMNVFVILSSIMITMEMPGEKQMTQIRRIPRSPKNDFRKFEALNRLSRCYCQNPFPVVTLEKNLKKWQIEENIRERYVGSLITTASFTVFFGGSLLDGAFAMAFAPLICYLQIHFERFCPNKVTFYVFCSFFMGTLICMVSRWSGLYHYDRVIMGDMMLLLPGLALMNSVRDVLAGNTISGIMRLTESLIWTGALVCGFMVAIWLVF